MARSACTGPPFLTKVTIGRPLSLQVREPVLRTTTSAIPPCRLGTNLTWPATWSPEARHGVETGDRWATSGGFVAVHGTAGPPGSFLELDPEPELQPAAERASTASATTALVRMLLHDYRNRAGAPRAGGDGARLPACERGQARCSRRPPSWRRSRDAGGTRPTRRLRRPRPPPPRGLRARGRPIRLRRSSRRPPRPRAASWRRTSGSSPRWSRRASR